MGSRLLFPPVKGSVRMADCPRNRKHTARTFADCHSHDPHKIKCIIQIITSVCSSDHIRCQTTISIPDGFRILIFPVYHTFIFPVSKIIQRRRPTDIIIHAGTSVRRICHESRTNIPGFQNIWFHIWYIFIFPAGMGSTPVVSLTSSPFHQISQLTKYTDTSAPSPESTILPTRCRSPSGAYRKRVKTRQDPRRFSTRKSVFQYDSEDHA